MSFRSQILTSPPWRAFKKSILSNSYLKLDRAPTTKAVGSMDVTKLEPTALVVGLQKIEDTQTFDTPSKGGLGVLISLFLAPMLLLGQTDYRSVENNTFKRGESLKYRVFYDSWVTYWMTAGFGTIEVSPEPVVINGRKTYHIVVEGKSANIFNVFFKVRDRFETYMDEEALIPHKFIRNTREGGYKKDDTVFFNHQAEKAVSTRKVKHITPNVQDIVSAFYYVRNLDFDTAEAGDRYNVDFFLDDSLYHSEIVFMGRETIKTDFGKLACMKFKPRVAVGEVFVDPYPMEMWVTDDKNKIPVLMKSAVFIGSVKIELIEFRGLRWQMGGH